MLEAVLAITMTVGIGSHHWTSDSDGLNERNPGIGLQGDDWTVGYYLNSIEKDSFYIGTVMERDWRYGDYGVAVGGITGYDHIDGKGDITPFVAPYVSMGNFRLVQVGNATGLQFVYKFGE